MPWSPLFAKIHIAGGFVRPAEAGPWLAILTLFPQFRDVWRGGGRGSPTRQRADRFHALEVFLVEDLEMKPA